MDKASPAPILTKELLENLRELQKSADGLYGRLPVEKALLWFVEEVGELSKAVRTGDIENTKEEIGQVFSWVLCLGNILNIDLSASYKHAFDTEACRQLKKHGRIKPFKSSEQNADEIQPSLSELRR